MEHEPHPGEQVSAGPAPSSSNFLPMSILVAAVMISGSILYAVNRPAGAPSVGDPSGNNQPTGDPSAILKVGERDVILGEPNAPVTLIEYSDFQCPFCGRFYSQTEPLIKENYVRSGKAKLIYRHFAFLGPESIEAAEASECAKDQGKFWAFHDALFEAEIVDGREHNGNLKRELFVQLAQDVGMDVNAFSSCYDENKYAAVVQQETENGRAGGVNATPTIFVNKEVIQGAQPYQNFAAAIDSFL